MSMFSFQLLFRFFRRNRIFSRNRTHFPVHVILEQRIEPGVRVELSQGNRVYRILLSHAYEQVQLLWRMMQESVHFRLQKRFPENQALQQVLHEITEEASITTEKLKDGIAALQQETSRFSCQEKTVDNFKKDLHMTDTSDLKAEAVSEGRMIDKLRLHKAELHHGKSQDVRSQHTANGALYSSNTNETAKSSIDASEGAMLLQSTLVQKTAEPEGIEEMQFFEVIEREQAEEEKLRMEQATASLKVEETRATQQFQGCKSFQSSKRK